MCGCPWGESPAARGRGLNGLTGLGSRVNQQSRSTTAAAVIREESEIVLHLRIKRRGQLRSRTRPVAAVIMSVGKIDAGQRRIRRLRMRLKRRGEQNQKRAKRGGEKFDGKFHRYISGGWGEIGGKIAPKNYSKSRRKMPPIFAAPPIKKRRGKPPLKIPSENSSRKISAEKSRRKTLRGKSPPKIPAENSPRRPSFLRQQIRDGFLHFGRGGFALSMRQRGAAHAEHVARDHDSVGGVGARAAGAVHFKLVGAGF